MTYIIIQQGMPVVADALWKLSLSRLDVIKRAWGRFQAFDAESRYELTVDDLPSVSLLQRTLAYTVYNPRASITPVWKPVAARTHSDLSVLVREGLAADDDILTQWFTVDEVMTLLESAETWNDLVTAVRCISGEHETDANVFSYARHALGERV